MWSTFFLVSFVSVVLLYLPGYFLFKAFRFPTLFSLAAAPIASVVGFEILAIAFDKLNYFVNGWGLFAPVFFVSIVLFGINLFLQNRGKKLRFKELVSWKSQQGAFVAKMACLYVFLGLLVGFIVLVRILDGPECFAVTYDSVTHLGLVRSFLETGHYSTFTTSVYRDLGAAGSYYPAAWHMVTAMAASPAGASNLVATNAMNYVCCSVVYPLSCLCLLQTIFADKKPYVVAGAFSCLAFITFPWFFVVYGVLESNLFGFIMVPVMLVAVMGLTASRASIVSGNTQPASQNSALRAGNISTKGIRVRYFVVCIFSVAFCLFAQPNAFFAVMLFSIPYLAFRIWDASGFAKKKQFSTLQRYGLVAAFLLLMAIVWIGCYKAPFLSDATHFIWPPAASKIQGLITTLLFSNTWSPPALAVSILVFIGLAKMLKTRKYAWIAINLGLACIIYWVGVCLEGSIDQLLGGFWYSDWRRTAALQAMAAVPVAAIGLAGLYDALPAYLKSGKFTNVILSALLLVVLFFPNFLLRGVGEIKTPFGYLADMVDEHYSTSRGDYQIIFSEPERAFVEKAKQITGDDIVYNLPYDGSMLAYQFNGLRTTYRLPYIGPGQNEDQEILQAQLFDYSVDPAVQAAVNNLGAKYVLQLDAEHEPYHRTWPDFIPENWEGISEITEDTPGFELVLSEGDMRLFKIKDLD